METIGEETTLKHQENAADDGTDEVDFVPTTLHTRHTDVNNKNCIMCKSSSQNNNNNNSSKKEQQPEKDLTKSHTTLFRLKPKASSLLGECEVKVCVKNNLHTLDKLQLFKFYQRKRSDPTCDRVPNNRKSKFVKSMTIAKLFGNNYNTVHSTIDQKNKSILNSIKKPSQTTKSEKFYKNDSENQIDETQSVLNSNCTDTIFNDITLNNNNKSGGRPFKTISRSFGKLLRRNYNSVDISIPDPEHKVSYLGNVLTAWARGKC